MSHPTAELEVTAEQLTQRRQTAALLRGILNDLKRRPEDAADELGVSLDEINAVLGAEADVDFSLFLRAAERWPINVRDLFGIADDAPLGVRVMRAGNRRTARVMQRAGAPYYEYRDTAMSRLASFRPEWIKELCEVADNDPHNPRVQWNNGHFMHQFTYFIGEVNFYYRQGGEKRVAVMNTGDSMYISPFVPHTFTVRKGGSGLILALTFGARMAGDAHHELAALGVDIGRRFAHDFTSRERAAAALLEDHLQSALVTPEQLAERAGLPIDDIRSWLRAAAAPSPEAYSKLAEALGVNVRDLLPPDRLPPQVVVQAAAGCRQWNYPHAGPRYRLTELARALQLPEMRPLLLRPTLREGGEPDLETALHQYAYNTGDRPLTLSWKTAGALEQATLEPGDSVYIKPFVPHAVRGTGELLVLRLSNSLSGDSRRELSLCDPAHLSRAIAESQQWFDPQGRRQ